MPDRAPQLTSSPEWQALEQHRQKMQSVPMKQLFAEDPERASRYFIRGAGISLDFSKNRITDETLTALLALAERCDLPARRDALLRGEPVNRTEQRPALHTALRHPGNASIMVDGVDVVAEVQHTLGRMEA
ncbi:MAG: glucose-6-phosphate isomerase, partial [Marinobacter alexandrii]